MPDEKTLNIQPPKRIVQMGVFVLAMLGLYLIVLAISALNGLSHPTTPPSDVITVTGTGQTSLAPDIARITFTVQNEATTVAAAQSATTKQSNAAIDYVKKQSIADKDVTTLYYNVSPQYSYTSCPQGVSYCPGTPKITGYQVSQTVQVTVRDLDKVSPILAGLGSQNVQNISGPNFTLESPTEGADAARALAIANAKDEAKILAKQLGVSLGRIVSFNEGGNYPIYATGLGGGAKSMDVATPAPNIPVGENQYTSTVSITYEIR